MVSQEIKIVTTLIDNVSGASKKVTKSIQDMGNGVQRATIVTEGLNKRGERFSTTTTQMTTGLHRFRMELLSVMFFGMVLYRVFTGLIKTSLEWMGVTELFSETLGILFLPLAELFLGIVLQLLDWVSGLTETQQKWIGSLVLVGIIFGGLLMIIGQIGLGLAGLNALGFGSLLLKIAGIGTTAEVAATRVAMLKTALGKVALVAIGITIAWVGFKFLRAGIEEGSIIKELGGIIGMGLGMAAIGLAIGGPWGAGIGFTLGITGAIVIDWVMGGKVGKGISNLLGGIGKTMALPLLGSFAEGGTIPQTGPYLLHKGETVVPQNQSNGTNISVTYNITGVSSPQDIRNMLEENNRKLTEDVRRIVA